jgi:hypothetical protein
MQRVYGAVDGDVSSWRPAPLKEHGSPRYLWTDAFGGARCTLHGSHVLVVAFVAAQLTHVRCVAGVCNYLTLHMASGEQQYLMQV